MDPPPPPNPPHPARQAMGCRQPGATGGRTWGLTVLADLVGEPPGRGMTGSQEGEGSRSPQERHAGGLRWAGTSTEAWRWNPRVSDG